MTVKAFKAIWFECEECGRGQFLEYTLEHTLECGRAVMADNIMCELCDHDNRVIEELEQ